MTKSIFHFLLVVLLLLLPCLAFAEEPKPTTITPTYGAMEFKAGEIIVKFKEGIPQAGVQSLLLAEDVGMLKEMDDLGFMLLSVPKGRELEKIEGLKRNPLVEYAEPNYVVQVANTIAVEPYYNLRAPNVEPNDPSYDGQWNLSKIEAPAAWQITTGSDEVVIAVISTGVALDHPELEGKIWTNPDEIPDNDFDDDGNGYKDDVHGWDFVNWDNEPQDDWGSGTFVATVAAAETNNGVGMAGVSWGAEIMPMKVLNYEGEGYIDDVNGAIKYAVDKGARILILDFQFPEYYHSVEARIDYAYNEGALVVAPMGDCALENACWGLTNPVVYPAALPHVLAVAATGKNDKHMSFSGYKPYVDVAAPGDYILGAYYKGGYGHLTSTYAATPHIAGLAALIWSVNPNLDPDEVESIIESTAVDLGETGKDDYFGHGRIDASAAVIRTPHHLQVEPLGLDFLVCDDCDPPSQKITNPNTSCSTWSATAEAPWLSISPCEPCEGYTPSWVTVSINKDSLPDYGLHTAPITATSTMTNYVNNPKTITATVIYSSKCWRNYLPLLFQEP